MLLLSRSNKTGKKNDNNILGVKSVNNPLLKPMNLSYKRDLIRFILVGSLTILFVSLLLFITTIMHFKSFQYDLTEDTKLSSIVNDTIRLVIQCKYISDYRIGNLIFFPVGICLVLLFCWLKYMRDNQLSNS